MNIRSLSVVSIVLLGLSACSPLGMLTTAGAEAGLAAMDSRGMDGVLSDKTMELSLADSLYQTDKTLFSNVDIAVFEGRILLAGAVRSIDDQATALKLAWQTEGVTGVINEMEITEDTDSLDTGRDAWIAAQLKSRLVFDEYVDSVNFSVETANRAVYVMGVARNDFERDRVIGHARQVNYVRRVVDLIRVDTPTQTSALYP